MGAHKTKSNLEVAMRENSSILLEDNFDKNIQALIQINQNPNSSNSISI